MGILNSLINFTKGIDSNCTYAATLVFLKEISMLLRSIICHEIDSNLQSLIPLIKIK